MEIFMANVEFRYAPGQTVRYLDVSPMISALRFQPDDFEYAHGWLRHVPSRHRFQFDRMGRVTIDALCGCAMLSIKPEQTDELVSMFKTWRQQYWGPSRRTGSSPRISASRTPGSVSSGTSGWPFGASCAAKTPSPFSSKICRRCRRRQRNSSARSTPSSAVPLHDFRRAASFRFRLGDGTSARSQSRRRGAAGEPRPVPPCAASEKNPGGRGALGRYMAPLWGPSSQRLRRTDGGQVDAACGQAEGRMDHSSGEHRRCGQRLHVTMRRRDLRVDREHAHPSDLLSGAAGRQGLRKTRIGKAHGAFRLSCDGRGRSRPVRSSTASALTSTCSRPCWRPPAIRM